MADYIDRQAVIDVLNKLDISDGVGISSVACSVQESAISAIQHLPSADAVEVVRCQECKYCRKVDESEYWCYGFCSPARLVRKDDFCSYGCKKENT